METNADIYYYVNGQCNISERVGVYGFTKIEFGELKYTKFEVLKNATAPRCQLCAIAYAASDAPENASVVIFSNDRNAVNAIHRGTCEGNKDVVDRFNFYRANNNDIQVELRANKENDVFMNDLRKTLHFKLEQQFLPKIEKVMSRREYAFVMNLRKLMKDFGVNMSGTVFESHDMYIDIPQCNADNILQEIERKAKE